MKNQTKRMDAMRRELANQLAVAIGIITMVVAAIFALVVQP
jgi:hypothetical protein